MSIEQLIERTGKDLQWVIKKCGNRYHAFNNRDKGEDTQVRELLQKIEKMVAGHSGSLFEIDYKISKDVEEKRRAVNEKMKQREERVKKDREALRDLLKGEAYHISELRVVLLGSIFIGKTSVANTILACGEEQGLTTQCVKRQGEVDGRMVTVIDTPGWAPHSLLSETQEVVKQEIIKSVSLCPPGPHAILVVIYPGISFTEAHRRSIEEHVELLGPDAWRHCVVVFSWGDWLAATTIEQHIEGEGEALQWLLQRCGNRYHVLNNKNWGDGTQVTELIEKIEGMAAANQLFRPSTGGEFVGSKDVVVEVVKQLTAEWKEFKEHWESMLEVRSMEEPTNICRNEQDLCEKVSEWLLRDEDCASSSKTSGYKSS